MYCIEVVHGACLGNCVKCLSYTCAYNTIFLLILVLISVCYLASARICQVIYSELCNFSADKMHLQVKMQRRHKLLSLEKMARYSEEGQLPPPVKYCIK